MLFRHGQFNGVSLLLLCQGQPLVQLLLEIPVTHLLENVGVAGFIHLECLAAMRADDVVHDAGGRDCYQQGSVDCAEMTALSTAWSALLADPHALLETVIIVGIVTLAAIGFFTGLREMAQDISKFRRAKV